MSRGRALSVERKAQISILVQERKSLRYISLAIGKSKASIFIYVKKRRGDVRSRVLTHAKKNSNTQLSSLLREFCKGQQSADELGRLLAFQIEYHRVQQILFAQPHLRCKMMLHEPNLSPKKVN